VRVLLLRPLPRRPCAAPNFLTSVRVCCPRRQLVFAVCNVNREGGAGDTPSPPSSAVGAWAQGALATAAVAAAAVAAAA
jgi:hypothetical protein